ncbi:WGR domain-containing protein [Clostridium sp. SHJSY1]|uniref:WGR domain-containing protein n=1 Tax=Clostridium sp. SHJSY1 TaxID=2942483 RepID=UPI0028766785|nr:WGR domain-containing protein [Clostridium sp. SHJSY1]MDS0527414.1 WGR domain-containing protein [Clostridium sp. SHJSY1]
MRKAFTYKDEKSNKFWWIDYSGKDFAVNYGKTGTNGKYEIKEFDSSEECEKEAVKLIVQKIKKGYKESLDFDFINHNYFDNEEIGLHPKTSHPNFVEHFTEEFYYYCGEEEAPFGNDNGADVLDELMEHIGKKGNANITIFPKMIIEKNWSMTYIPPDNTDESYIINLIGESKGDVLDNDRIIYMNDEVIIAAAFGQIKITGTIEKRLQDLAINSLKRMEILRRHLRYPKSPFIEKMKKDLESFRNTK